jgi:hypothetical protein
LPGGIAELGGFVGGKVYTCQVAEVNGIEQNGGELGGAVANGKLELSLI